MNEIELKSRAKINLCLDVTGKRDDGYHELKMVMQTIGLHDKLMMRKIPDLGIELETDDPSIPTGEENLVYKVIRDIMKRYGIEAGIHVDLYKTIPSGAGLAGGSANAATAIKGMNLLFDLNMPMEEMASIGIRYGADIPYCLLGGTAIAEGIGERLTPLPDLPELPLLIVKPEASAPTARIFQTFEIGKKEVEPDVDGMARAIETGDVEGVLSRMGNALEATTVSLYPEVEKLKGLLIEAGADNALMSGSGTAVFGIFMDRGKMEAAAEKIRQSGLAKWIFQTRTENESGA